MTAKPPDILIRAQEPGDLPDLSEARNPQRAYAYVDSLSMARLRL